MPLDPQTQSFVDAMLPMDQYTPSEVRASIASYGPPPVQCEVSHVFDTTIPGPDGPLPARVYSEADPAIKSPALLFLHGSGFVLGGLDSHDNFCRQIASRVDSRLSPSTIDSHPSISIPRPSRTPMPPPAGWPGTATSSPSRETSWRSVVTAREATWPPSRP